MEIQRQALFAGAIAVLFFAAGGASGALVTWNGVNGDYNTGSNWSSAAVPAATDDAVLNSGTATRSSGGTLAINTGSISVLGTASLANATGQFHVNGTAVDPGEVTVNTLGSLTMVDRMLVGQAAGNTGLFTLTSGTVANTSQYAIVGGQGTGTFTQNGGVFNATNLRGFFLGDSLGATGHYTLNNGTLNATVGGELSGTSISIGQNGTGHFTQNGGLLQVQGRAGVNDVRYYLNNNAANSSTHTMNGGTANFSNLQYFVIGRFGTGTFTLNDGDLSIAFSNTGANTIAIVGDQTGATGILNVHGGSFTVNAGGSTTYQNLLTVGAGGNGTVNQTAGLVSVERNVLLAQSAAVTGIYNLSGGELSIEGNLILGPGQATFNMFAGLLETDAIINTLGAGQFNYAGGTIILEGDQQTVVDQAWFDASTEYTVRYDALADVTIITNVVPEPASVTLFSAAALMLGLRRRRAVVA